MADIVLPQRRRHMYTSRSLTVFLTFPNNANNLLPTLPTILFVACYYHPVVDPAGDASPQGSPRCIGAGQDYFLHVILATLSRPNYRRNVNPNAVFLH
jgi:hypothetical protein